MSVIVNTLVAGGDSGGSSSTVVNNYNTIQNITNNSYTATGNGILSGGGVVLTGSYGYLVGSATYSIQGTTYTSPQTTGTLATADPSNPRIDIFVLGIDGTASVIQGTAAATPSAPFVDPTLYVETGFVLVPTGAPPALTNEQIYQEDTGGPGEWNFTTSGTGITLNSTANPYTGTVNIQLATTSAGAYWQGARPSGSLDSGQFNSFAFAFYPTAFANNQAITIQLYNSGVAVGNPISFKNGSQNFNAAQRSYQVIVYPTSVFGAVGVTFNQIRFTSTRSGLSGSFDYCFFQSAVVPVNAPAPMIYRDVWNTTSGYNTNDVVIVGTLNNVTAYVALQPNVNQVPGTATTVWKQISQSTLTPLTIGAGSTNITHATQSNRLLIVNQAGATGAVFAGTGTSGAVDGDEVYILNIGAGTLTMSGAITAATGYTLTVGPGVLGTAVYSATANAYYSSTPSSSGGAGTVTSVDASGGVETASGSAITASGTIRGAVTVNAQTGTSYTYLTGDRGKLVTHTNAAAIAGTLPQATGTFGANWYMWVENRGAGTLTITPTTSTIDGAATLALTTGQGCLIASDGTNYFTMRGVGGAASGGTKTYAILTPMTSSPPATVFATLDTRNSFPLLTYDDTTDEGAFWTAVMPEGASLGSGLIVNIKWAGATATSGNVVWQVDFMRLNTTLDSDSYDTAVTATTAVSGTTGVPVNTAITITTIDGIVAGDAYSVRVKRLGSNGSDTMTGLAQLVTVEVRAV